MTALEMALRGLLEDWGLPVFPEEDVTPSTVRPHLTLSLKGEGPRRAEARLRWYGPGGSMAAAGWLQRFLQRFPRQGTLLRGPRRTALLSPGPWVIRRDGTDPRLWTTEMRIGVKLLDEPDTAP
ncbi:MAG: hypothetical protein IKP40_08425 [Clostridia bacterium]|nr:hypothetical protein [Clostridia bacterium]